ncbi:YolD-like family protein [Paenibacillus dokdonensis]|uniref:YolD-like family protein n=1 Tax=Paenibacillus dokdonensis TaxID=2567944 RepID=A0ABU6GQE2_9BACL|nr:YolD-like family protein [Paenibacillus dokdonensis]MEC0241952.1 YolD-like family protein [Paenibacillus dokdonensis]
MYAVPKPPGKKSKATRPTRDDFELQELAEKLEEAKENHTRLNLTVWRMPEQIQGMIDKLDSGTQKVHVQTRYDGLLKIPFIDIMKAFNVE